MIATDHHAPIRELLPAYALGSLDADEVGVVTRHLDGCANCRNELAAFQGVADALALAAPDAAPSAGVRRRLLAAAANDVAKSAQPSTVRQPSRSPSVRPAQPPVRRAWPAYALLGLVAVLLGGLLWSVVGGLWSPPPPVTLNPTDNAPDASGELRFARDGRAATLSVVGLPSLPPDRQYQLWIVREGVRDSGAVFSVDDNGWAEVPFDLPFPAADYERFGITIEPAGGSPGPTGDGVLRSQ